MVFQGPHLPLDTNSGLEVSPGNVISGGGSSHCNTSSEAGAPDTGGTSRDRLGPKIFLVKNFSKFFWKPLLSTIYVTLIIMSRKYFFDFWSPDPRVSLLCPSMFAIGISGPGRTNMMRLFCKWLRTQVGTDRKSGWIRFRPDIRLQNPAPVGKNLPDFSVFTEEIKKKCLAFNELSSINC